MSNKISDFKRNTPIRICVFRGFYKVISNFMYSTGNTIDDFMSTYDTYEYELKYLGLSTITMSQRRSCHSIFRKISLNRSKIYSRKISMY